MSSWSPYNAKCYFPEVLRFSPAGEATIPALHTVPHNPSPLSLHNSIYSPIRWNAGTPALLHHRYPHSPEVPPNRSSIACNPPHRTVILFPNSVPPTFTKHSRPSLHNVPPRVHLLAHTLSPQLLPQSRLTHSRATTSKSFSSLAVVPISGLPKPTFGLVSFSPRTPPHTCSSVGPVALEKVVD